MTDACLAALAATRDGALLATMDAGLASIGRHTRCSCRCSDTGSSRRAVGPTWHPLAVGGRPTPGCGVWHRRRVPTDPPTPRPAPRGAVSRAMRVAGAGGRVPGSAAGIRPTRPPRRLVAAAAIIADGAVLAARRTAPPAVAGRWELPGGKVEPGESPERAAVREVMEELGVAVRVGRRLGGRHPIRPGMSLIVVLAELLGPAPTTSVVHDRLRWLRVDELEEVDWLPADRPLLGLLRAALTAPASPTTASPRAVRPVAGAVVASPSGRGRRGRRPRGRRRRHDSTGESPAAAPDRAAAAGAAAGGHVPGGQPPGGQPPARPGSRGPLPAGSGPGGPPAGRDARSEAPDGGNGPAPPA